jgi:hypothetical protein
VEVYPLQINEIIEWIDGAFELSGSSDKGFGGEDFEALFAAEGYQRYLQDQINRHIIRDYLANAVLLGVISDADLAGFAVQLASEESRSALALHMLMSSVDEAMGLLPLGGQVELLTPLQPKHGDRPHIKLVPN